MGKPVSKKSIAFSVNALGDFVRQNPSQVTDHEKYGKQIWLDFNVWEDGSESISAYSKEQKTSVNLGKVFPPKDNGQMSPQKASVVAQTVTADDDLPY
jgi:hypothetical protein